MTRRAGELAGRVCGFLAKTYVSHGRDMHRWKCPLGLEQASLRARTSRRACRPKMVMVFFLVSPAPDNNTLCSLPSLCMSLPRDSLEA